MDELTFLLIIAGIGVILLVALFTYYKHHKKIQDEIQDFNTKPESIDDVLLNEFDEGRSNDDFFGISSESNDFDMPDSFSASRQDNFDIEDVNLHRDTNQQYTSQQASNRQGSYHQEAKPDRTQTVTPHDERELVDGVYINTKRVISHTNTEVKPQTGFTKTTDTFKSYKSAQKSQPDESSQTVQPTVASTSKTEQKAEQITERTGEQKTLQQAEKPALNVKDNNQPGQRQSIKIVYDSIPEGVQELIISHTILARGEHFRGRDLFAAIKSAGLSFGEMNIFHYPGDDKSETFALFSVANVVEPGTFNPDEAESFTTPGISMFMRLPTRIDSNKAYDKFIQIAQQLAKELNGELCDETRSQLTQQAIAYKKEQIRQLNFELVKAEKLAGMKG
jgi:cell division protein ZipA